jgi:hypothetical protein
LQAKQHNNFATSGYCALLKMDATSPRKKEGGTSPEDVLQLAQGRKILAASAQ